MKKKIISTLLSTIIGIGIFPIFIIHSYATDSIYYSTVIEYLEDGSYIKTDIIEHPSTILSNTITGQKNIYFYNSDDELQWLYTIEGSYNYDGYDATCTSVSDSFTIYNDNWHIDSHSCWRSSNKAYGTVTMKKKILGITVDTIVRNVSLSCSPNGNLS